MFAKRGMRVMTDEQDEQWITEGIFQAYRDGNYRYSQAPLAFFRFFWFLEGPAFF